MQLDQFFMKKAFYYLSGGGLDEVELSLLFYFFSKGEDCFESFLVQLKDLSCVIKQKDNIILDAIYNLQSKRVIKLKESQKRNSFFRPSTFALNVNQNFEEWNLDSVKNSMKESEVSTEKVEKVFKIKLVENKSLYEDLDNQAKLLVDFYIGFKGIPEHEKKDLFKDAQVLIGTYSFEASLFVLKHFYEKITSFSDLLSNWTSYQGALQKELQKIDFIEAKKQHDKDDKEFCEVVRKWILLSKEKLLTEEETRILEILIENSHPRRQLFWAYRFRDNYPNLKPFFQENLKCMLPVTTKGHPVKK